MYNNTSAFLNKKQSTQLSSDFGRNSEKVKNYIVIYMLSQAIYNTH